jgi:hypothetical protein
MQDVMSTCTKKNQMQNFYFWITVFGGTVLSPQGGGFKALTHYVQDFIMKLNLVPFNEEFARKLVFL